MAGTSGCSRAQLKEVESAETSCAMGGSGETSGADLASSPSLSILRARGESTMEREKSGERNVSTRNVEEQIQQAKAQWSVLVESASIEEEHELDYVTAAAEGASDHATESLSFTTARTALTALEEEIERSRAHWSTLADQSGSVEIEEEEVAEVSNVEVFLALQRHPSWGSFFATFGYDTEVYKRDGELEFGEKFAEGGQAELYNTHVTWWCLEGNEEDLRDGREYVVKVFKKGTFLKHLQSQLPQGLLHLHVEDMENLRSPTPEVFPRYFCKVLRGILLEDGRFAFLMEKDHFDLRNLIERQMGSTSDKDCGPFSKEEVKLFMYDVALGVNWIHSRGIIHRDLKASNILVREYKSGLPKWGCYVADYECSIGVVGIGFFRAPEILQACKDRMTSKNPKVFPKVVDSYSFGMTCYEVLTGKLPFEDHPLKDSLMIDLVINQHLCLEIPEYVEDWTKELLRMCWQVDPIARPSFGEILDLLSTNSVGVRRYEDSSIKYYRQIFRNWRFNS
jgi:serine/threonine protein kinase